MPTRAANEQSHGSAHTRTHSPLALMRSDRVCVCVCVRAEVEMDCMTEPGAEVLPQRVCLLEFLLIDIFAYKVFTCTRMQLC